MESEDGDPVSLLNTVRALLALRHSEKDLQAGGDLQIVYAAAEDPLFVYRRGGIVLAVNPSGTERVLPGETKGTILYAIGQQRSLEKGLVLGPQSFVALRAE